MKNLRDLINIVALNEDRDPNIEYDEKKDRVVAKIGGNKSGEYTRLAKKIRAIEVLEKHIKGLKEEVKASGRTDVADLFSAEDAVKTRVIQTVSFLITMSKDPEPTKTLQYKEILEELEEHLTPELITVLNGLKATMVSVVNKAPSLKATPIKEDLDAREFRRLRLLVKNWCKHYDSKLNQLKKKFKSESQLDEAKVSCTCANPRCGKTFVARSADIARGWGKFCSKACKASEQESRTGQYKKYMDRKRTDDGYDVDDDWAHPFSSEGHGQQ